MEAWRFSVNRMRTTNTCLRLTFTLHGNHSLSFSVCVNTIRVVFEPDEAFWDRVFFLKKPCPVICICSAKLMWFWEWHPRVSSPVYLTAEAGKRSHSGSNFTWKQWERSRPGRWPDVWYQACRYSYISDGYAICTVVKLSARTGLARRRTRSYNHARCPACLRIMNINEVVHSWNSFECIYVMF